VSDHRCSISRVVVVVVDTTGRGIVVVVSSTDVVLTTGFGEPQPASKTVLNISAAARTGAGVCTLLIIVTLHEGRVSGPAVLRGVSAGQRTVVVSVVFRVVDVSPSGETVVPVVVVLDLSVTTPLLSVERRVLVSIVVAAAGAGSAVVDCVDDVLDVVLCACAAPAVIERAAIAAIHVLIILNSPGYSSRTGSALCPYC
jgi:hypothetical protein